MTPRGDAAGPGEPPAVNSQSPTPLHQQLMQYIRVHVEEGRWQPGQRIPSERELCDRFHISRTTVRQAIAAAVHDGLLRRVQGKGTFVERPTISQPLFQITSFEQTLRSRGWEPGVRLLECGVRPAPAAVAGVIGGEPRGEVAFVRLVGLGGGEPLAVYDSHLPPDIGRRIVAEAPRRAEAGQLFFVNRLIAELHGWDGLRTDQTYEAAVAGSEMAALLGVPARAPVFVVTSLFFDPAGRPVEHRRAVYRGDRYRFRVSREVRFDAEPEAVLRRGPEAWAGEPSRRTR